MHPMVRYIQIKPTRWCGIYFKPTRWCGIYSKSKRPLCGWPRWGLFKSKWPLWGWPRWGLFKSKPTLSVVRPFRCCMYSLYHFIIVIPLTGSRSIDLGGECKRNRPSSYWCLTMIIYVGRHVKKLTFDLRGYYHREQCPLDVLPPSLRYSWLAHRPCLVVA